MHDQLTLIETETIERLYEPQDGLLLTPIRDNLAWGVKKVKGYLTESGGKPQLVEGVNPDIGKASIGGSEMTDKAFTIAFGYDMDQMSARGWVQAEMPIDLPASDEAATAPNTATAGMVRAAEVAANACSGAVIAALGLRDGRKAEAAGLAVDTFWHRTEADFFRCRRRLAAGDATGAEIDPGWHRVLADAATGVFDETVPTLGLEAGAFKRIVQARRNLIVTLRGYGTSGKALFEALNLPVPETKKKKSKKAAA